MKKYILILVTLLSLIYSCSDKETKKIYDNWNLEESWVRSNNYQNWENVTPNSIISVTITKNSWEPLIEGECYIDGEDIILVDNSTPFKYQYTLINSNEIQFRQYDMSTNDWIWKVKLTR